MPAASGRKPSPNLPGRWSPESNTCLTYVFLLGRAGPVGLRSLLAGAVAVDLLLAGPIARQDAVGIGIRGHSLVAVLAGAVDPCIAVRARYLADLPGIRVADGLLIERVVHPVRCRRAPGIHVRLGPRHRHVRSPLHGGQKLLMHLLPHRLVVVELLLLRLPRSEERRVGKECRSR